MVMSNVSTRGSSVALQSFTGCYTICLYLFRVFFNYDRLIPGYVFAANKIEAVHSEAARQKVPFVF